MNPVLIVRVKLAFLDCHEILQGSDRRDSGGRHEKSNKDGNDLCAILLLS